MPNILPVSDLRNYNEVLKNCHKGEPVYLTKNGRGRIVVMDIEDYDLFDDKETWGERGIEREYTPTKYDLVKRNRFAHPTVMIRRDVLNKVTKQLEKF